MATEDNEFNINEDDFTALTDEQRAEADALANEIAGPTDELQSTIDAGETVITDEDTSLAANIDLSNEDNLPVNENTDINKDDFTALTDEQRAEADALANEIVSPTDELQSTSDVEEIIITDEDTSFAANIDLSNEGNLPVNENADINKDDFTALTDEQRAEADALANEIAGPTDELQSTIDVEKTIITDEDTNLTENTDTDNESANLLNKDSQEHKITDPNNITQESNADVTGDNVLDNILGEIRGRSTGINEVLDGNQDDSPPAWASEQIPLDNEELSKAIDNENPHSKTINPTQTTEIEADHPNTTEDIINDDLNDEGFSSNIADIELQTDDSPQNISSIEVEKKLNNEEQYSPEIVFDEEIEEFETKEDEQHDDLDAEIMEDDVEEHSSASNFDVSIDEEGKVIPDSVTTEPVHTNENSHVQAQTPEQPQQQGQQQAPQQAPQQVAQQAVQPSAPMGKPLFGSLGSLFQNLGKKPNESLQFQDHMKKAADRDIQRLRHIQHEHFALLNKAVQMTSKENYTPKNESKVVELLSKVHGSARAIEKQTERLDFSTSNMKEQRDSLTTNNNSFAKDSKKLGEELENNTNNIDSSAIQEAAKKLTDMLKKLLNKILRRDNSNDNNKMMSNA